MIILAKKKKDLSTAEKLKIINSDIELWLLNFVKIMNEENELIPFKINHQQKDFLENRGKFNLILKSRRLGFSTLSLGVMLYYAYQIPRSTYLMVAHDKSTLRELFNALKTMQNNIPEQYKLKEEKNNRDELELENGSRIIVKCPDDGIGAGMKLQIIHLSEYALYSPNVQETALVAVEQSLAKNKDSMVIIESTARGVSNNFYKMWQDSSKNRSRYKGFFYPWTTKTHLNQFRPEVDEAVEWYKSINKGRTLSSDPLELTTYERNLLEKTDVTLLQLMWRQYKLFGGMSEEMFRREYPAFPEESFTSSDVGVFNAETILNRMYYIPEPIKNVEGLPLSLQRYLCNGLNIYELPKKGEWTFGGVDTALGTGKGDYSAICILNSDGDQVATFKRNDIPTYRFVDIVNELGHFYNYCIYMIERNSYGIDILQRLHREKGYVNLSKTKRKDKITGRRKWEHGWYNDNVSKTILVNDLLESFETGLITVNDKETLEQMKIYQENKGSFGNVKGADNYDDLVDALGLSVQAMKMGRYYI